MRLLVSAFALTALFVPLGGCVAVSVATTAVSVTASAVGTVADAGVSAASAAIDLATPSRDCSSTKAEEAAQTEHPDPAQTAPSRPREC